MHFSILKELKSLTLDDWANFSILASGVAGTAYTIYRWLKKTIEKPFKHVNEKLVELAENYLPHIEQAIVVQSSKIDKCSNQIEILSTEIKAVDQRMDDTKAAVHTLEQAFLNRIDHPEKSRIKTRKAGN